MRTLLATLVGVDPRLRVSQHGVAIDLRRVLLVHTIGDGLGVLGFALSHWDKESSMLILAIVHGKAMQIRRVRRRRHQRCLAPDRRTT